MELESICYERDNIVRDENLSQEDKQEKLSSLQIQGVSIEDLSLTMTYNPASSIHEYSQVPLCENGESIEVSCIIFENSHFIKIIHHSFL